MSFLREYGALWKRSSEYFIKISLAFPGVFQAILDEKSISETSKFYYNRPVPEDVHYSWNTNPSLRLISLNELLSTKSLLYIRPTQFNERNAL